MLPKRRIALLVILSFFLSATFVFADPISECAEYAQLGVPAHQGQEVLCKKGHLLAHDPEKKTPVWVIEHLTKEKAEGLVLRSNNFKPDPALEKGKRAELSDYSGSEYDRGHMAPAADMRWHRQAMAECFFLSNMVPQDKGMNRGIWKSLEENIRDWAIDRNEVYILTGPIGVKGKIGKNKVAVPTHLYKIVYDPHKTQAIAFIMANEKLNIWDMRKYIVTIREIEKKTGLDFLSSLDRDEQERIETKKADGLWQ